MGVTPLDSVAYDARLKAPLEYILENFHNPHYTHEAIPSFSLAETLRSMLEEMAEDNPNDSTLQFLIAICDQVSSDHQNQKPKAEKCPIEGCKVSTT